MDKLSVGPDTVLNTFAGTEQAQCGDQKYIVDPQFRLECEPIELRGVVHSNPVINVLEFKVADTVFFGLKNINCAFCRYNEAIGVLCQIDDGLPLKIRGIFKDRMQIDQACQTVILACFGQIDEVSAMAVTPALFVHIQTVFMLEDDGSGIVAFLRTGDNLFCILLPGLGIVLIDYQVNRDIVRPVIVINRCNANVSDLAGKLR